MAESMMSGLLVKTARPHDGRVDDVGPVGRSNDEDILLASHTVHLSQNLVDHPVRCTTSIASTATPGLCNGVKFLKEEDARGSAPGLVKHIPHICLGLSKPHGQQLWTLDGDEVGLALIGNGLGEQGLTTTRGSVEENAAARHHAKLEELLRMLDWVLHQLLQLSLDILKSTNILPGDSRHLHHALPDGRGCALAHSVPEVGHGDGKAVQHLGVNGLVLQVDQVHLLPDLLQSCLAAQSRQVGADVSVSLSGHLLEVQVVVEFHVLCVDPQDLHPANCVRDSNVNLPVEPAKPSEGWVDRVGPVGRCHHDDMRPLLQTVHESEQLGHNSPLNLTIGLLSLGSDGVELVNEDDGGRVLLGLLKSLPQVALALTSQLAHDLGTIDEEEEGTSLICNSPGHQGLTSARRAEEQDAPGRLHSDGLEELRVPEWKFHHLLEGGQLLPATSDVVVTDGVQRVLLILSLHRLSLAVDHRVRGDNAVWRRVRLNYLELNSPHASPDDEVIPLVDWPVRLKEVGLQVNLKPVPCQTLHTVVDRQNVDPLAILHVRAALDGNDVAESHPQVVPHHPVHPDLVVGHRVVAEDDADALLPLLSLQQACVAAEQLQLIHLGKGEGDDAVVVIDGVLHQQPVWLGLLVQDRCGKLFPLLVSHPDSWFLCLVLS